MLTTHQFIFLYFFEEMISCFIHIFQSQFLTFLFCFSSFSYFFLIYFESNYIFSIKPRVFRISIDYSSLKIFLSSFSHLLQITERTNVFFKNIWHFRFLKFPILTTNIVIGFFHLNLFSYWKYFSIILSFFSYLLGENKLL